jgi:proline dehydrogenase
MLFHYDVYSLIKSDLDQMYTKAAQSKLERDVERANKGNFAFAAKLVRGAYMVSERKVRGE